jgi:hypothetical protein
MGVTAYRGKPAVSERGYWRVTVVCWGEVVIYDTSEAAEEWRRHKATWEQCIARIRAVDEAEVVAWLSGSPYRDVCDANGKSLRDRTGRLRMNRETMRAYGTEGGQS